MGLYVVADLPDGPLQNALGDYATHVERAEVLALYDATLSGTGCDGAVFCADHFVFQNHDWQAVQTVRYPDLVGVEAARRWWGLAGKTVELTVNRGRATFDLSLDCSGHPMAADHIAAFLHAVMIEGVDLDAEAGADATDVPAVRRALDRLRAEQSLSPADHERLLEVLEADAGDQK